MAQSRPGRPRQKGRRVIKDTAAGSAMPVHWAVHAAGFRALSWCHGEDEREARRAAAVCLRKARRSAPHRLWSDMVRVVYWDALDVWAQLRGSTLAEGGLLQLEGTLDRELGRRR